MQKLIALALALFVLSGCTPAGGIRPTKFSNPSSYLQTFPLGEITEKDMLAQVGPPDRVVEFGGKKAWVYRVQESGNRTFTYIFGGATVGDVVYNENGGLNGASAREEQRK